MTLSSFLKSRVSKRACPKDTKSGTAPSSQDDETMILNQSPSRKVLALHSLGEKGRWKEFLAFSKTIDVSDMGHCSHSSSLTDSDDGSRSSKGSKGSDSHFDVNLATTPLHIALAYRPPLDVVEAIISEMKSHVLVPEETPDESGSTPLHVAAAHFTEEEVFVRLLQGESLCMPAYRRDNLGRTPLHCAAAAVLNGKRRNKKADEWKRHRIMHLLIEQHSEAIFIRDDAGKTPVEYGEAQKIHNSSMGWMQFLHREKAKEGKEPEDRAEGSLPGEVSEELRCNDADEVASVDLFLEDEEAYPEEDE